jgi:hypothetical protein
MVADKHAANIEPSEHLLIGTTTGIIRITFADEQQASRSKSLQAFL